MKFIIPIIATESTSSWYQRWHSTLPGSISWQKNRAALTGYAFMIVTVSLFVSVASGGIVGSNVPSASALGVYPVTNQVFQDPILMTTPPLIVETSAKPATVLPAVKPVTIAPIPAISQASTSTAPLPTPSTPMVISPIPSVSTTDPVFTAPTSQVAQQQNSPRYSQKFLQPAVYQDTYQQAATELPLPIDTASQVLNTATDQAKSNSYSQPVSYTSGRISDQLRDRIIILAAVSGVTAAALYLMSLFGAAATNKRKVLVRYIDPVQETSNR